MSSPAFHRLDRPRENHFLRRLILSAAIGCVATVSGFFSGSGNSAPASQVAPSKALSYEGLTAPTSIGELLRLLNVIGERRLLDHNDFYTEETLKRLFGDQKIRVSADPGKTLTFDLFGFRGLLIPWADDSAKFTGVEFLALKHIKRPPLPPIQGSAQMSNYRTKRRFQAMIYGSAQGLDFNTVVSIFGLGWKENREAENERYMAIAREPFNPPPPQATGYMANSIITYTTGASRDKQAVSLRFDEKGMLCELDSVVLYVDP